MYSLLFSGFTWIDSITSTENVPILPVTARASSLSALSSVTLIVFSPVAATLVITGATLSTVMFSCPAWTSLVFPAASLALTTVISYAFVASSSKPDTVAVFPEVTSGR